ncbi:MAG: hypothetical protein VCD00_03585, partial [Candidatus Hydrogenedentota bacterium]
ANQCDYKVEGDHSIISNLARIQYHGNDPEIVAAAQVRLRKLSRWERSGSLPDNKALRAVLRSLHDTMAPRTMSRLLWMTPEWVDIARQIVSTRARSDEFSEGLKNVEFTFSEMFTDGPEYAFPGGGDGGFWVTCFHGEVTVGFGPLPEKYGEPGYYNEGLYTPILPVGRTVNPAMTDADKKEQGTYLAEAFKDRKPTDKREFPIRNQEFPKALGGVMSVLHDELSKRTSGELPSDYDDSVKPEWGTPQKFDRNSSYDASWVLYDKFDIYGNPR